MYKLKQVEDLERETARAMDSLYSLQNVQYKDNRRLTMFVGIALIVGFVLIGLAFHYVDMRITRLERKIREQEQTIYYLQEGGDNVMEHIEYIECEITPEYCQRYDAYE